MHVAVVGTGRTGAQVARALRLLEPGVALSLVDTDRRKADALAAELGPGAHTVVSLRTVDDPDVTVLCVAAGAHTGLATTALRHRSHVVSVGDAVEDVDGLFGLDGRAGRRDRVVVVGAGFSPGLSGVLARHAAGLFDRVDEVAVFTSGTGGPACARQHHRSLRGSGPEWCDGAWARRRGSTGRRLAWFPDPIGARDCYRAALPEPLLLRRAVPEANHLSARLAATRRDRLTGWLPMLRPPHADGGPGGLRVEVWGRRSGVADVVVYGAAGHPASVAGTVAAFTAHGVATGSIGPGAGSHGLAEVVDPTVVLATLGRFGVAVSTFEGAA